MTSVYKLDPLGDPRWRTFVERHPHASVFHSTSWIKSLRQTYGYEPVAFTTSSPTRELENGLLFCQVTSWLTGTRMVSLPFSDHCEPLCSPNEGEFLTRYLRGTLDRQGWKYLEIRPLNGQFRQTGEVHGFRTIEKYHLHRIDLQPGLEHLFRSFDKDSIQRRVHHAQRSGIVEKRGQSEDLLRDLYALLVLTRRRHHLPPQPYAWFKNLVGCFGHALEIRTAYKHGAPVASVLTLRFRDIVYYKYGGSDPKFNNLGAMPFLLWNALVQAKASGAAVFDLGRTGLDSEGLLTFKNNWIRSHQSLEYWKFPASPADAIRLEWKVNFAKRIFSYLPKRLLPLAGRMIYPHIG